MFRTINDLEKTVFVKLKSIFLLCSLNICSFCKTLPKFVPVSDHKESKILSAGRERVFRYYLPRENQTTAKPLIFVLHGGGGNGEAMIYLSRITDYAEQEDFIVVYPTGYANRWNDGRGIQRFITDQLNIDDVQFFRDMIEFFKMNYNVDSQRIHVVGISNGGFMAQRLICEASDLFASGFSVAATSSVFIANSCNIQSPVSVGFIFGKKDDIIPFNGGNIYIPVSSEPNAERLPGGESLSYQDTVQLWKNRLKCDLEDFQIIESLSRRKNGEIIKQTYMNSNTNSRLEAHLIEKGGHVWPHGFFYVNEKNYGYLTDDIDASRIVLNFFKQTPKIRIGVN